MSNIINQIKLIKNLNFIYYYLLFKKFYFIKEFEFLENSIK